MWNFIGGLFCGAMLGFMIASILASSKLAELYEKLPEIDNPKEISKRIGK